MSKINVRISQNREWAVGGSYLFKFGIVNFSASRKSFPNGSEQTRYTVGSFIPLSVFDFTPGGWQLFPAFGYSKSEGVVAVVDTQLNGFFYIPTSSSSGYLGLMGIKPIGKKWTLMGGGVGAKGSGNYSGYSVGAGLTYKATERDSFSVFGIHTDNSFGTDMKTGISYKREF